MTQAGAIPAGVREAVFAAERYWWIFLVTGSAWARLGHGALAAACLAIGIVAFVHPGNTFRALAGVGELVFAFTLRKAAA